MIYGVDTSFANGSPNWPQAFQDDRVKWLYSRCCYGDIAYDDDGSSFTNAHDAAKAAGVPFCSYMFWLAWLDGAAQAQHYVQVANGRYGQRAIVDVEEGSGLHGWGSSLQQRIENLAATLDGIKANAGTPWIYTDPNTWETYFGGTDAFSGHGFIIADYGVEPGKPNVPNGVHLLVAHQFSDGSGLPPIPGLSTPENNVDRDVLIAADFSIFAEGR